MSEGMGIYLAIINLLTFCAFALDKYYAMRNMWRIREGTLLVFSLVGGTPAALAGMALFRHKRSKSSFIIRLWLVVIVQVIALFYFRHEIGLI